MGGGQTTFAEIAGNVTDAAFYDMTAAPDTTYTYRVRAENSGGLSSYSGSVTATAPTAPGHSTLMAWDWGVLCRERDMTSRA